MNPELLKILACPACHHKLDLKESKKSQGKQNLYCAQCDTNYKIEDDIIQFVSNETKKADE